jgi:hypothetical protein
MNPKSLEVCWARSRDALSSAVCLTCAPSDGAPQVGQPAVQFRLHLPISKALNIMIVHHPHRLHERITDR